jgi:hypothetical protein
MNTAGGKKTARVVNAEDFANLKMFRGNIIPFTKCVRFVECDEISVAFAVSALAHLE